MKPTNAGYIDEYYLDRMDSHRAYVLGALYDCYSRFRKRGIAITTEKKELLEMIISEMRISNSILTVPGENCYFVRYLTAEYLRTKLEDIMYGKTGEERMFPIPSDMSSEFYRDFFRGFFESRLRIQKQTKGSRPYLRLRINYNTRFLEKAFEILHKHAGLSMPGEIRKIMYLYSEDIEKLVDWMYSGCDPEKKRSGKLFLRQKRDAFIEVAREIKEKRLSRSNGEAEDF